MHILPAETARIHCGAGDRGFLRKPYLVDQSIERGAAAAGQQQDVEECLPCFGAEPAAPGRQRMQGALAEVDRMARRALLWTDC